jgi:PKD repeat protein
MAITMNVSVAQAIGAATSELPNAYIPIVSGKACSYVQFDCSGSHDPLGKDIVLYKVDFGDGTSCCVGSNPIMTHWYAQPGTYKATLQVVTVDGRISEEDSSSIVIEPANRPPIVVFASGDTIEATQYSYVSISCIVDDADQDDKVSIRVWFGDADQEAETYNISGRLITVSHVYITPGLFWVTVIANDTVSNGPVATIPVLVVDKVVVDVKYNKKYRRLTIDATASSFASKDSNQTIITVLVPHRKIKIPVTLSKDQPVKQLFGICTTIGSEFSATSSSGGSVAGTVYSE